MSGRDRRNYKDLKASVDAITNTRPRYIPINIQYVHDRVDTPIKEDIVYIIMIFILVNAAIIFYSPTNIKKSKLNKYGVKYEVIDYKLLIKWSAFITFIITAGLILYNR